MHEAIPIAVVLISAFTGTGWIVWVIATNIRRTKVQRTIAEMHAKLLDRFGSSPELLAYVESDAGKRFLTSAAQSDAPAPYTRILNALQVGLILCALGLGVLGIRLGRWNTDVHNGLLSIGMPVVALGLGFLVSACASYVMSKNLGLLPPPGQAQDLDR